MTIKDEWAKENIESIERMHKDNPPGGSSSATTEREEKGKAKGGKKCGSTT